MTFSQRFRKNRLKIGVFLIVLGLACGAFAYQNSKPNINGMTAEDIPVVAESIDGIGKETLKTVVANAPYEDMSELKQLDGIGKERYRLLKHHFSTKDICRRGIFDIALLIMVIGVIGGCTSINFTLEKDRLREQRIKKDFGLKR